MNNIILFSKYLKPNPPESKLILALNRIEANRADVRVRASRMEEGDGTFWREFQNWDLRKQRQARCGVCLGTGEVTVSDGTGCIAVEKCPRCTPVRKQAKRYPVAGDVVEVKF